MPPKPEPAKLLVATNNADIFSLVEEAAGLVLARGPGSHAGDEESDQDESDEDGDDGGEKQEANDGQCDGNGGEDASEDPDSQGGPGRRER